MSTQEITATVDSPTRARPWVLVFGTLFVCAWSGNQFSPMLLLYRDIQHYSTSTVTLFLGIYVAGLAPALVVAGAISDHSGRRTPMFYAVCFGLAASALLALGEFGSAPIYLGRLFAGMSVGTAMSVGTSWLKEVSQMPYDVGSDAGAGARRASLAFTLGSASGALVAGTIAQWGPAPTVLPYAIHVAVTLPFLWLTRRPPETVLPSAHRPSLRTRLHVPSVSHRRFLRIVVVCGPWLFAACALSYGYLPVLLADAAGSLSLAYATGLSVIALVSSALIQPVAKRIDSVSSARGTVVSLVTLTAGLVVMMFAVAADQLLVGALAGVVFGAGFGIGLVSGLLEVQRIAPAAELARLTGVFYAIAYLGFIVPTILAALTPPFTTLALLGVLVILLGLSTIAVVAGYRKHLPIAKH
ncbi:MULTISPECIES: MFS transporter [unclassified Rhodococcus (in: high G+C Gram-positive bacteria)]|uniref:MFS transporter n=1 Tax=unclassified Rhodococcus (in: high G+C Gram-positive bacteria) TaxID=192944 RepID=UPI00163A0EC4|nr:MULTISPECIES: MFS transporter [unclassified Rhodococcus (in: high G+C Gram-positive bacteria)]MBC2641018.1 MFS transporter [Rhodococcus sp. 3A]MBC2894237.1 MFS transporter [Rhodococcus sp. 4CII]